MLNQKHLCSIFTSKGMLLDPSIIAEVHPCILWTLLCVFDCIPHSYFIQNQYIVTSFSSFSTSSFLMKRGCSNIHMVLPLSHRHCHGHSMIVWSSSRSVLHSSYTISRRRQRQRQRRQQHHHQQQQRCNIYHNYQSSLKYHHHHLTTMAMAMAKTTTTTTTTTMTNSTSYEYKKPSSFTIILPAHNEEERISQTLRLLFLFENNDQNKKNCRWMYFIVLWAMRAWHT